MNDSGVAVSVEQVVALLEFLEAHPDLALGKLHLGKEGRMQANRLWKKCAGILNNVAQGCVNKTDRDWRIYYAEYKSKLKKKLNLIKRQQSTAGAEFQKKVVLTPLQKRLYKLLMSADNKFPASLSVSPPPVPIEHVTVQKPKMKQDPYQTNDELSSETNTLLEVERLERLNVEVVQKNTAALLENAAASCTLAASNCQLAASIDRLTEAINHIIPAVENKLEKM